jgi:extracellular factor (EF) 3-hydroxypalmitic acid methyl ester biosynthesis protein
MASKYSFWIRFSNNHRFKDGAEFSKLVIKLNGDNAELGPCKLIAEPNIEGYAGRLTFINDFCDLENLLSHHKIVKLQSDFLNLPLVLAHKGEVKRPFKDYISNLTYDLTVYKNLFDKIDREYDQEPEVVKEMIQKGLIDTEGQKLFGYLDDSLVELGNLTKHFTKEEHERHGFYLRKQLWNFLMGSPFMARTNLKPRGYSGDSVMMRMIYDNRYEGESTFSKVLHKHPLEHPGAQAVRNRRVLISKKLNEVKKKYLQNAKKKIRVLSVACGPARELLDLLLSPADCEFFHFTLLDQDRQALLEAAQLVDQLEKQYKTLIDVDYLNESVRTMLATPQLNKKWGQFHFIYSMGLFDYLTPPVAAAVLKKLHQLLKPGGELIIGNFHNANPSRHYMAYWLDWVLFYRSEEEFIDLLKDAPSAKVKVKFEDTRVQMFLQVVK